MKIFSKLIVLLFVVIVLPTNAQEYNFGDYMYPFGCRTFLSLDSEGKTTAISQFSFTSQYFDNYLVEETYIGIGMLSAKNIYQYNTEGNAVISNVQLRQNALTGSTQYQDKITLFAFPAKDKPYVWSETDRGDKISCKSEYVFVKFRNERTKAIKITKTTTYTINKVTHKHKEISYWVEGFGRIVTYASIDGGKKSISSRIDSDKLFEGFAEIP